MQWTKNRLERPPTTAVVVKSERDQTVDRVEHFLDLSLAAVARRGCLYRTPLGASIAFGKYCVLAPMYQSLFRPYRHELWIVLSKRTIRRIPTQIDRILAGG